MDLAGGAGRVLVFSGMDETSLRKQVWESYYIAYLNAVYFKYYHMRVETGARIGRAFLAVASAVSLLGLFISNQYQLTFGVIGTLAGLVTTVLVPAFKLEGYAQTLIGIRNRWIDARDGLGGVWNELQSTRDLDAVGTDLKRWQKIAQELEKDDGWFPESSNLRVIATRETTIHFQSLLE